MGAQVADILVRIVEQRRRRMANSRAASGQVDFTDSQRELLSSDDHPFLKALLLARGRAVIAEIKMGSPRLGSLADRFDPVAVARSYGAAGAAALSVVVEPDFFFGSYDLLTECKSAAGLPAIAKDFIVDPCQLVSAANAGADAILLIAALYRQDELMQYANHARSLGLVPLIETHSTGEFAGLRSAEWELIGVNNRNLTTFEVDLENSFKMISQLPSSGLKIAESGISTPQDLLLLSQAGFDAFLIGESLLLAEDPGAKLRELISLAPSDFDRGPSSG
jgi:indole-3-glycerol phosphate synthase